MSRASVQQFLKSSNVRVVRAPAASVVTSRRMHTPPRQIVPAFGRSAMTPSPRRSYSKPRSTPRSAPPPLRSSAPRTPPAKKLANGFVASPLKMTMFNAVSTPSKPGKIDIVSILKRRPKRDVLIVNDAHYALDVKQINGKAAASKTVATHYRNGTKTGNASKVRYVEFKIDVYLGPVKRAISVYVYANGGTRVTGGVPGNNPRVGEFVRRYILDKYTKREKSLFAPLRYVSLSGQFDMSARVAYDRLRRFILEKRLPASYEPEIHQNFFQIKFKGKRFQVHRSGTIQMFGEKTVTGLRSAYALGRELASKLAAASVLVPRSRSPPPAPKKKRHPTSPIRHKPTVTRTGKGVVIDGRLCAAKTMTKDKLKAYARRLGVVLPNGAITKAKICIEIARQLNIGPRSTGYTLAGIKRDLMNAYGKRITNNAKKRKYLNAYIDEDARLVQQKLIRLPKSSLTNAGTPKRSAATAAARAVAKETRNRVSIDYQVDDALASLNKNKKTRH